jgi:hypothetical protein
MQKVFAYPRKIQSKAFRLLWLSDLAKDRRSGKPWRSLANASDVSAEKHQREKCYKNAAVSLRARDAPHARRRPVLAARAKSAYHRDGTQPHSNNTTAFANCDNPPRTSCNLDGFGFVTLGYGPSMPSATHLFKEHNVDTTNHLAATFPSLARSAARISSGNASRG